VQLNQMRQFILLEAREKADEIRTKVRRIITHLDVMTRLWHAHCIESSFAVCCSSVRAGQGRCGSGKADTGAEHEDKVGRWLRQEGEAGCIGIADV